MTIEESMRIIGEKARDAAFTLKNAPTKSKNNALKRMAEELRKQTDRIVVANKKDLDNAKNNNLEQAKIDRLVLNSDKINKIADGLEEVAALADPINQEIDRWTRYGDSFI